MAPLKDWDFLAILTNVCGWLGMISEFSKLPERLFSCIPSYFYNSTIILGKCKITTLTSSFPVRYKWCSCYCTCVFIVSSSSKRRRRVSWFWLIRFVDASLFSKFCDHVTAPVCPSRLNLMISLIMGWPYEAWIERSPCSTKRETQYLLNILILTKN